MSGSGVGPDLDVRPRGGGALAPSARHRPETIRKCRVLGLAILVAAGCVAVSMLIARVETTGQPGRLFWLAAAVIAAGQLARIRIRIGADYLLIGLGESAIITAFCLVPPVWVPLAVAAGVTVAHIDRVVTAGGPRWRVPYTICAHTISATAASTVVAAFLGSTTGQLHPDTAPALGILVVAAAGYSGVGALIGAAGVADERGIGPACRDIVHSKRFIFPANVALGLAVAIVFAIDPRWLVALVPVVAILHRAYVNQAEVDDGSLWWENLAAATRGLSHPAAVDVVAAAMRSGKTLFGAEEVQVGLHCEAAGPDHAWTWYGLDGAASVIVSTPLTGPQVVARPLVVGDKSLGEIRLRLNRAWRLDQPGDVVLTAFAAAVATALRDAHTHHDLQVLAARSAFDAVHDPLTGLANRSMLVARGDAELARRPIGSPGALVLLDVDGFRSVNDTLNPAAGDDLLRLIAQRLAGAIRYGEILARLGGDEFALLLAEDTAVAEAANERAKEIAAQVAAPFEVAGVTIGVTATVGVGLGRVGGGPRVGGVDTDELMRRAGAALQRARRAGVPLARYAEVRVPQQRRSDRHTVLADLRDALATTNQLAVVLQPVVCLATERPVGAEVLVRWHHPRRGPLLPSDFLGVIERSDLIDGFTRHVVDMALGVAADWPGRGIDLAMTVNLCARSTLDPQLPDMLHDRLAAHGVRPDRLIVEITEAVMLTDPDKVKRAVSAVRELGVQVSVGDFGTASASLALLARCRVDEVKIDRTFVATMTKSPETAAIVTATVALARELDIRVVAEAVERPEQRAALEALGVAYAQGHLFYPPLSPVDIARVIARASV
jgi:diguanylate cyclase (GGDEF)-like protein